MIRTLLAVLAMLPVLSTAALAQDQQTAAVDQQSPLGGLYVQGFGGIAFTPVVDAVVDAVDSDLSFDPGLLAGASVGYELPMGFAVEGEILYRLASVSEAEVSGTDFDANGDVSVMTFGVNSVYNLDLGQLGVPFAITPFLGAGVGLSLVSVNNAEIEDVVEFEDDTDTVISWQVMTGAKLDVSETWNVSLGYRYMSSFENAEMADSEFGIDGHGVTLGVGYRF